MKGPMTGLLAAWFVLAAVRPSPAAGGWAPFDCADMPAGSRYGDEQRQRELALIPYPNPRSTEEFLADMRDFELRQALAPDWQWFRHLPWLRDRYLDSDYGRDVRDFFLGLLRTETLDVEEWRANRCNERFDDRSFVVIRLIEKEGGVLRATFVFHRDGTWMMASHGGAGRDPRELREEFVATSRALGGRDPEAVEWASFTGRLCSAVAAPCIVGRLEGQVLVAGPGVPGIFRFDPEAPFIEEQGPTGGLPVAAIGDRRFRRLESWSAERRAPAREP